MVFLALGVLTSGQVQAVNFTQSSLPPQSNGTTNNTNSGEDPSDSGSQSTVPSQPALLPAVHWNHDPDDLQNVAPQENQSFYYTPDGVAGQST